jgi:hypothetical protein
MHDPQGVSSQRYEMHSSVYSRHFGPRSSPPPDLTS